MRLLAFLHRLGINPALVAGLVLMPMVVAMGYVAGRGQERPDPSAQLRGSFDAMAPGRVPAASPPF